MTSTNSNKSSINHWTIPLDQRFSAKKKRPWVVVSTMFYFHPKNWLNDLIWRSYFSDGWFNHQLGPFCFGSRRSRLWIGWFAQSTLPGACLRKTGSHGESRFGCLFRLIFFCGGVIGWSFGVKGFTYHFFWLLLVDFIGWFPEFEKDLYVCFSWRIMKGKPAICFKKHADFSSFAADDFLFNPYILIQQKKEMWNVKVGFWWCWGLGCETFPVLDVFVMTFLDLIWDVETLSQSQSPPTIYVYGHSDLELDSQFLPKNRDVMKTSCCNHIAIPDRFNVRSIYLHLGSLGGKCRYFDTILVHWLFVGVSKNAKIPFPNINTKKKKKKRGRLEILRDFRGKCSWIFIGTFKTRNSTYTSLKNLASSKQGNFTDLLFGLKVWKNTLVV